MAGNPRQDLFLEISRNLNDDELQDLRNYVSGANILAAGFAQTANAHQIFIQLEKEMKLELGNLTLLAELLTKIGRQDYAQMAKKIAEDERKDTAKAVTTMEERHKAILRAKRLEIASDLRFKDIRRRLLDSGILNRENLDEIENQQTRGDQVNALLDILPTRGANAFSMFRDALKHRYPHLARILNDDGQQGAPGGNVICTALC